MNPVVRMSFQLVKFNMTSGYGLLDMIYGRKFSPDEIATQPIKEILFQSLLLDNEIEKMHLKLTSSDKPTYSIGPQEAVYTAFQMKHPELVNAEVTMLTTEEYLSLA